MRDSIAVKIRFTAFGCANKSTLDFHIRRKAIYISGIYIEARFLAMLLHRMRDYFTFSNDAPMVKYAEAL